MASTSSKAFVAAQVRLRECNKQMHRLNDADELAQNCIGEEYIEQEAVALRSTVSQERVNAEASKINVPKNWRICVVIGPGAATPRPSVKRRIRKSKAGVRTSKPKV